MNDVDDQELLRRYAHDGSEAAFAGLVSRHIDLVYSAARRMVIDPHLAEDVTQAVFLALAKSAAKTQHICVLSGWLHRTARNLSAATVRGEIRRRARENEVAIMNQDASAPDALWEQLAPHLDEALAQLAAPDRDALLLRYFERKTTREIGERLGLSEDAAQKRIGRALERLRGLFDKRGVAVTAPALAGILSLQAVQQAPAALAASVTASSLAAIASTSTVSILHLMASAKLKFSLVSLLAAGMTTAVVVQNRTNAKLTAELAARTAQLAQTQPVPEAKPSQPVDADEMAALGAEHAELLRLRGEVAVLRQRDRQRITPSPQKASTGPNSARGTGDFIASENWKDMGTDTPGNAFQSFLTTLKTGDLARIESTIHWDLNWKDDVSEEDRKLVEKSKQDYLEMLQRAPNKLTAFSLAPVQTDEQTERTRVFFHTITGEGTEVPSSLEMIRLDGRWKPVLSMGWRFPKESSSFYTTAVFGPAIDLER